MIKFLAWASHPSIIGNLQLFVAYEEKCICLTAEYVRLISFLKSNLEKVDTRMLLHVKHINPSIPNVVVFHPPDADVFVIALAASTEPPANLFIQTGRKGKHGLYPLRKSNNHCVFNIMSTILNWLLNLYLVYMLSPGATLQVPFAAKVKWNLLRFFSKSDATSLHLLTLTSMQVLKMAHSMFFNCFFAIFMAIKGKAPIL